MDVSFRLLVVATVFLLIVSSGSIALPVGGNTTLESSERGTNSTTTAVSVRGGNVSSVDVTGTSITSRWSGFFGNISSRVLLGDSSNNEFFEWTVTNVTGSVVYATNDSISDWGLSPASSSVMPSYLLTSDVDNFTNTFNKTEDFSSKEIGPLADTPYVSTWNSTGVGILKTYALQSSVDNALLFAGKAIDGAEGFQGSALDYQILVPAQSTTTYSFYLELP